VARRRTPEQAKAAVPRDGRTKTAPAAVLEASLARLEELLDVSAEAHPGLAGIPTTHSAAPLAA
jgi:hypothetical protein